MTPLHVMQDTLACHAGDELNGSPLSKPFGLDRLWNVVVHEQCVKCVVKLLSA